MLSTMSINSEKSNQDRKRRYTFLILLYKPKDNTSFYKGNTEEGREVIGIIADEPIDEGMASPKIIEEYLSINDDSRPGTEPVSGGRWSLRR